MRHYKILSILVLSFLILSIACSKSDEDDSSTSEITYNQSQTEDINQEDSSEGTEDDQSGNDNSFDRVKMMTFITEEIIIPSYDNLNTSLTELKESYELFKINITEHNLEELRNKWLNSYKLWQHVEMYNIGKSMEDYLIFRSNIYPVDTVRVNQNIDNGEYDLENPNNYAAQGFPTMDYLLYGIDNDPVKVIDHYKENNKLMNYLGALIEDLAANVKTVNDDWNQVKNEFVNSVDNTASSNLNMMVNDFIYYYEKGFRANKFGIPAGVFSGGALPDRVEGFYSKNFSKVFALEAMTSIKKFFNGESYKDDDLEGLGLKSYLDFVEKGKEELLSDKINAQLIDAEKSINDLDNNLSGQIESDLIKVLKTYDEIQTAVVLLKVDMLQALNIAVDYADADGD
ncbi:MAG: peptidase M75 superfamily protein [Flavobacteriaceae bacterium]|nr:peptidase M75 superfamily protein [Flavobacteriaceae bacterium]